MLTERVAAVIEGRSNRRKGFTQYEVAELFAHDIEACTSTENFRSEPPILWHYRTIEAIKTKEGLIIANRQCWSAGFAYCTLPEKVDLFLDLTSLQELLWFQPKQLANIEVLDKDERSVLLKAPALIYNWMKGVYELKGIVYVLNEVGNFAAILAKPCKTVQEAYESMKPDLVREYERQGKTVYRQGEWFFIPFDEDPKLIQDIKSIKKAWFIETRDKCPVCGKVGRWLSRLVHDHTDKFEKVEVKRYHLEFPELEEGSNHTARKVGKYKGQIVALGPIRHINHDHEVLRIQGWFYALKNIVRKAISTRRGVRD